MHRNTPYGVPVHYGYSDGKITEPTEKIDAMMKMIPDPFRPFHQGIAGEEIQKESCSSCRPSSGIHPHNRACRNLFRYLSAGCQKRERRQLRDCR